MGLVTAFTDWRWNLSRNNKKWNNISWNVVLEIGGMVLRMKYISCSQVHLPQTGQIQAHFKAHKPHESSPHSPSHFSEIHFNINSQFTNESAYLSLSFRLTFQNPLSINLLSRVYFCFVHLVLLCFIFLTIFEQNNKLSGSLLCNFANLIFVLSLP